MKNKRGLEKLGIFFWLKLTLLNVIKSTLRIEYTATVARKVSSTDPTI